ncbi:penicillin-binding protein 2 [Litorimonas haliclonae]|uniref:penicillin-binding protein 2 n=1 Tax=Litorimonas haliclonae TaxID=2081977 RepID=UPI0039F04F78
MARKSKITPKNSAAEQAEADNVLSRRTLFLGAGGMVMFGVLGARLYDLQVRKAEDYIALSENNRFNYNIILPSRGRILDRNSEPLAVNHPNYRVVLIPERSKDIESVLKTVGEVIDLSPKSLKRIHDDIRTSPRFVPITIQDNMDWKTFAALNMRMHNLPGIIPEVAEGRAYPNGGIFAHTLGYIGRAGDEDIAQDKDPLLRQPTFRIGKTGVEAAVEDRLRGASGKLKVEVNAVGRIVREWPDPKDEATPGDDVYLTLDAKLQKFAADQFADDSGGISVMDCVTGELRTLLSMPSFDGNLFVNGLTQADMDRMNSDPKRPQFNKVIGGGYPPASTFKMVVMLAALESGLIDPRRPVFCVGRMRLGNRLFHCWKRQGHGAMTMRDGLKHSCDTYFYEISQVIGINRIADMARRLGLGQNHDVGIAGEKSGIVPDEAWKKARLGSGWRMGDTLNASIGQGFVLATPLQLSVMAARLANAQLALKPSLIIGNGIPSFDKLDIDPAHLAFVREAMHAVCEEPGGTAYRHDSLKLGGIEMAGKTGTGQVRGISASERATGVRKNNVVPWELRDHSIFVGFAPYDKPRFAVGTIVEHGGSGAGRAADITRNVLSEALRRDGMGAKTQKEAAAL